MLRLIAMVWIATFTVLWRRLCGRSRCARWTLVQEVTIDVQRRNGLLLMRLGPERARRHLASIAAPSKSESLVSRERVDVDGLEGEWVQAPGVPRDRGVLIYYHGGGYVFGTLAMYRDFTARLALATRVRVLAVACRRAPESRFPAATEDAVRAYRWLRARDVSATRIVLGGDSSGGALVATTLLILRDANESLPAGAFLISPWVDLEAASPSVDTHARLDWGDRSYLLHWARMYLGEADPRDPLASPLHARLDGLPPLLVMAGGAEVLSDEVTAFARRAQRAGARAHLELFDDMPHGWQMLPDVFPQAKIAVKCIARFVDEQLAIDAAQSVQQ